MYNIGAFVQKSINEQRRTNRTAESPKVHFLTFANTGYMRPTRILREAAGFNFDTVHAMNEHSIPEFIAKHRDFITRNKRGYGIWIWKPKIILEKLSALNTDDILIYCDAGMHLNVNGIPRYREYMRNMNECDILTFSLNDKYKAQQYVKRDAIDAYHPEFAYEVTPYCYAGVMVFKKTSATMRLVTDWLGLCENYHFLDSDVSVAPELGIFEGNDGDNGLFNVCLAKHRISRAIYPDETNVYSSDGFQSYSTNLNDWNKLREYPFQYRRMRPAKQ